MNAIWGKNVLQLEESIPFWKERKKKLRFPLGDVSIHYTTEKIMKKKKKQKKTENKPVELFKVFIKIKNA